MDIKLYCKPKVVLSPNEFIPEIPWKNRYHVFEKYDKGVELDAEGWYDTIPECVATFIADKFSKLAATHNLRTVLDACSGCGGSLIALAKHPKLRVTGVEKNDRRVEMVRHNAEVYGVQADVRHENFKNTTDRYDMLFIDPPRVLRFGDTVVDNSLVAHALASSDNCII